MSSGRRRQASRRVGVVASATLALLLGSAGAARAAVCATTWQAVGTGTNAIAGAVHTEPQGDHTFYVAGMSASLNAAVAAGSAPFQLLRNGGSVLRVDLVAAGPYFWEFDPPIEVAPLGDGSTTVEARIGAAGPSVVGRASIWGFTHEDGCDAQVAGAQEVTLAGFVGDGDTVAGGVYLAVGLLVFLAGARFVAGMGRSR